MPREASEFGGHRVGRSSQRPRFLGGFEEGRVGSGLLGGRASAELGIPRTRSLSDGEGSWALKFES